MSKPLILVTAATGKTGSAVFNELRARDWPVRAIVRREDERSFALQAKGAEIVVADLLNPGEMTHALADVRRAYWCAPFDPLALEAARIFAKAATDAKLEAIVGLSQWLASPAHPALATRNAWETDRLFAALSPDIGYTIINPGFFADNYLRLIGFAAQLGVLPSLTGDSRNAPPSNEDIARVAVAVLTDPVPHAGRSYRPTGPELLNTSEMAAILSSVLGRKVRAAPMPLWLFLKAARMQGVQPYELSGFRYYIQEHKQGAFAVGAPTDSVRILTGRESETFEMIARRYAALPEAKRSFGNGARAWLDFLRTPMMPGYNLTRFDRSLGVPAPSTSHFVMDDSRWRAEHGVGDTARPLSLASPKPVLA